jgi:predicted cation transporter
MPDRAAVRSSLLAHPVALLALVTLVVNDHLLKTAAPGFLTGKLSDVAGLVVVPVLVAELVAVAGRRVGRREGAPSMVPWTAFATGLGFAAVKLTPIGAEAGRSSDASQPRSTRQTTRPRCAG